MPVPLSEVLAYARLYGFTAEETRTLHAVISACDGAWLAAQQASVPPPKPTVRVA